MSAPDRQTVLDAIAGIIQFAQEVGGSAHVQKLVQFHQLLQTEKPTLKLLQGSVKNAADESYHGLRPFAFADGYRDPWPGKERLAEEFNDVYCNFNHVIYPPRFIEKQMPTTGFAGSDAVESKTVRYMGGPTNVQAIFERSVELVKRYTQHVIAGDLETAYALTSPELQAWMSFKRYTGDHARASRQFGGEPVEFLFEGFGWIFPDDEARNNAEVGRIIWPRAVPKPIRRATAYGFWVRDRAANTGCHGQLWITENDGAYRIAQFSFSSE
jgi:hypothetical protein